MRIVWRIVCVRIKILKQNAVNRRDCAVKRHVAAADLLQHPVVNVIDRAVEVKIAVQNAVCVGVIVGIVAFFQSSILIFLSFKYSMM